VTSSRRRSSGLIALTRAVGASPTSHRRAEPGRVIEERRRSAADAKLSRWSSTSLVTSRAATDPSGKSASKSCCSGGPPGRSILRSGPSSGVSRSCALRMGRGRHAAAVAAWRGMARQVDDWHPAPTPTGNRLTLRLPPIVGSTSLTEGPTRPRSSKVER
jgi:hypothetical protein